MKFLHNFLKNSFDNFLNRLTWGKLSDAQHICSWTYPPPKSQHFAADFIHTSDDSLRIFGVLYRDPCKEYTQQAACFNWYNLWFSRLLRTCTVSCAAPIFIYRLFLFISIIIILFMNLECFLQGPMFVYKSLGLAHCNISLFKTTWHIC